MRNFLVVIALVLLGLGINWGYGRYQTVVQENQRLREIENNVPSSAQYEIPTPTMVDEKGTISGKLGYPAEGIPELTVYAFDITDETKYFKVETGVNQIEFTITDVDPGSYYVVAYAKDFEMSGSYTNAVVCGLSVECTDHQMIDVTVKPGENITDVQVKDWYAPEGTFPKKPSNN